MNCVYTKPVQSILKFAIFHVKCFNFNFPIYSVKWFSFSNSILKCHQWWSWVYVKSYAKQVGDMICCWFLKNPTLFCLGVCCDRCGLWIAQLLFQAPEGKMIIHNILKRHLQVRSSCVRKRGKKWRQWNQLLRIQESQTSPSIGKR